MKWVVTQTAINSARSAWLLVPGMSEQDIIQEITQCAQVAGYLGKAVNGHLKLGFGARKFIVAEKDGLSTVIDVYAAEDQPYYLRRFKERQGRHARARHHKRHKR